MKKIDIQYDSSSIASYIEQIQQAFPNYEVNVNNCNDFSIVLANRRICRECKALAECRNENKGYYLDFIDGAFTECECGYKKIKNNQDSKSGLIKTLYLPESILNARLEDFHLNCESRQKIYKYISSFIYSYNNLCTKGLYLYGSFSIGKTYTLACIANELSRNDIASLLIYFPDLVVDLKNAIGTPRFEQLLNMLKSIDVLMLDDIGSENMTPWLRDEVLGPIINYRAMEKKPMFISSNLSNRDDSLRNHLAIDKSPASILKADRLIARLQALVTNVCMDDGQKYLK